MDNKDWVPPLLLRFKQYSAKQDIDIPTFVMKLERLGYYLFVTRSDVNARIFRYADVLNQIDPRDGHKMRSKGLELSDEDVQHFINALNEPVYLKSRVVKPLLLRLDLALSDGSAVYDYPTISVEHVCPQTIELGSQWDDWFSDRKAHDDWLHRLANLVLLTHRKNSRASNWDFSRKKSAYFTRDDACPILLTQQVLDLTEWTPTVLESRQKKLLRTLLKDWGVENIPDSWLEMKDI